MTRQVQTLSGCLFALATFAAATASADGTVQYSYDAMGRLVGVEYADGTRSDFVYDNAGNRLFATVFADPGGPAVNRPPGEVSPLLAPGSTDVSTRQTLAWTPAVDPDPDDSVAYYVYLGAEDPPPLAGSGHETTFTLLGKCLEPATTYYWQVVARDRQQAETPSPVWQFTTADEHDGGRCASTLIDWDGDGVDNDREIWAGTDVFNPDTDGDGMDDSWERDHGTDAVTPDADADVDGDGVVHIDEMRRGTDPLRPDTDADDIDDGYEIAYGLNPLDPSDARGDADGDGIPNLVERYHGTAPDDATDQPARVGLLVESFEDAELPLGWFQTMVYADTPVDGGWSIRDDSASHGSRSLGADRITHNQRAVIRWFADFEAGTLAIDGRSSSEVGHDAVEVIVDHGFEARSHDVRELTVLDGESGEGLHRFVQRRAEGLFRGRAAVAEVVEVADEMDQIGVALRSAQRVQQEALMLRRRQALNRERVVRERRLPVVDDPTDASLASRHVLGDGPCARPPVEAITCVDTVGRVSSPQNLREFQPGIVAGYPKHGAPTIGVAQKRSANLRVGAADDGSQCVDDYALSGAILAGDDRDACAGARIAEFDACLVEGTDVLQLECFELHDLGRRHLAPNPRIRRVWASIRPARRPARFSRPSRRRRALGRRALRRSAPAT